MPPSQFRGTLLSAASRLRATLLAERLQELGLPADGAVGAALATLVGTPVSASTILRQVRTTEVSTSPTLHVLSIDGFAFRKGPTYGTILVDLERHYPVDLLPDREPETVAAWLCDHPGVAIISRDHATGYARAAREGALAAILIADHYHLLPNLGAALKRLIARHPAAMKAVTEQLAQLATTAIDTPTNATPPQESPTAEARSSEQQMPLQTGPTECDGAPQNEPAEAPTSPGAAVASQPEAASSRAAISPAIARRFAAIKELQAKGRGQREIARRLVLHQRTVQRYMVLDEPPIRAYDVQC
jgi:hypothetical protein